MRAPAFIQPVGLGRLGFRIRNKSGLARGKDRKPGKAVFPPWRGEGFLRRRRGCWSDVLTVGS